MVNLLPRDDGWERRVRSKFAWLFESVPSEYAKLLLHAFGCDKSGFEAVHRMLRRSTGRNSQLLPELHALLGVESSSNKVMVLDGVTVKNAKHTACRAEAEASLIVRNAPIWTQPSVNITVTAAKGEFAAADGEEFAAEDGFSTKRLLYEDAKSGQQAIANIVMRIPSADAVTTERGRRIAQKRLLMQQQQHAKRMRC